MQNDKQLDITGFHVNMKKFKADRDAYIAKLNGIYKQNLDNSKVEHIKGRASFLDNNTLE